MDSSFKKDFLFQFKSKIFLNSSALYFVTPFIIQDQVSSLQQQLEKLNKGEIGKPAEVPLVAMNTEAREIPYMELSISCDNLRCDGNGWPPSTQAVLYHRTPPSCHWQQTGKSEHVPDCSNPQYLVTIPLWSSAGVQESTKYVNTIYFY